MENIKENPPLSFVVESMTTKSTQSINVSRTIQISETNSAMHNMYHQWTQTLAQTPSHVMQFSFMKNQASRVGQFVNGLMGQV